MRLNPTFSTLRQLSNLPRVSGQSAASRKFTSSSIRLSDFADFATTTRKVVCIGRNYVDHIKELGNVAGSEPFFFLKPPSSISPPGSGPVLLPRGINTHFEIELGLVIASEVRDFSGGQDEARGLVAGYFLAIDLTARNVQELVKKQGLPWTTAKGFDTYLPVSKYLTKSQVVDPENVVLKLKVNGVEKQHDSTNLMIYKIPVRLNRTLLK